MSDTLKLNAASLKRFMVQNGFLVVLAFAFCFFYFSTPFFGSAGNLVDIMHTIVPLVVMSIGLALVVIAKQIDISIGSIAFLSAAVGAVGMNSYGWDPVLAFFVTVAVGLMCGLLNGFLIVVLKVNSLITTLGTMIAFRGLALELTEAVQVRLPEEVRVLGNLSIGPIFVDVIVAAVFLVGAHYVHRQTPFGRWLTAIGNDEVAAAKVGIPVNRTVFASFAISGVLASIGGILMTLQLGQVSAFLGQGVEFIAIAVIVVGGISLSGGRGHILSAIPLGAALFEVVRNGLIHLGADPYYYRLAGGAVVFIAMYADAIKTGAMKRSRGYDTD